MSNPHLTTLQIIQALGVHSSSAADLMTQFSVSVAGLKRHISEGRLLGAKIQSVRSGKGWVYVLANHDAVRVMLTRWIELELARDLT